MVNRKIVKAPRKVIVSPAPSLISTSRHDLENPAGILWLYDFGNAHEDQLSEFVKQLLVELTAFKKSDAIVVDLPRCVRDSR
jgi:hypothetical protein